MPTNQRREMLTAAIDALLRQVAQAILPVGPTESQAAADIRAER